MGNELQVDAGAGLAVWISAGMGHHAGAGGCRSALPEEKEVEVNGSGRTVHHGLVWVVHF